VSIRKAAVASAPADTARQRELAQSHEKVGDALKAQANQAGALAEYQNAEAILQRLVKMDSNNATWRKQLAALTNKLGRTR
jgi:Flp pilus assembly protein TadD